MSADSSSVNGDKLEQIDKDELGELKKKLEKKPLDPSVAISILKVLSKKQMTKDLLRETMIGKTLTQLSDAPSQPENEAEYKQIKELSESLKIKWKKQLQKKEKSGKQDDSEESKANKKTANKDGIQVPSELTLHTGDQYRDPIRKKLVEILQTPLPSEEDYDEQTKRVGAAIALEIEERLNSKFKDLKAYGDKARSLVFNLRDPKNPNLRKKILTQDITAWDIVTFDPKELASEDKKKEREDAQKANMAERRTDWLFEQAQKSGAGKGFFTCRKCHSKNTTYYQMQTRGADEPMTNFVTCLDCRTQFKC